MLFRNYAYGQAQIKGRVKLNTHDFSDKQHAWTFEIPDLSGEVSQYLIDKKISPENSLFFVFMGTNDFLNYSHASVANNQAFVNDRLAVLYKQVDRLIDHGANRMVVFNMRALENSPLAKQLEANHGKLYMLQLKRMIAQFNAGLAKHYANNKYVVIYDIHRFDAKLFNSNDLDTYQWYRQTYTIKEKVKPCYENHGNYVGRVGERCSKPWQYVFYDRIHLTTYVNRLMSSDLYAFLVKKHWIR